MDVIEEVKEIITQHLNIPADFGISEESEDNYSYLEDFCDGWLFDNCIIENGATKLVILSKNLDYVIKVPFNGFYKWDEENFEENFVEYIDAADTMIPSAAWDYVQNEVDKYSIAKESNYEKFFAKTEKIIEHMNHPIYIQEKVTLITETEKEPSKMAKASFKNEKWDKNRYLCPSKWTELAIDYYGEEEVQNFFSFLRETGLDDDLHSRNVGIRKDGSPCIFDYSGYRG